MGYRLVPLAEYLREFTGFQIGSLGLFVSHLLYADDTLFIGKALMTNLWCMKSIQQCVSLASNLIVNFAESNAIGMNVL